MAAQEMTVTVRTKSLFPSFSFNVPFVFGGCIRAQIRPEGMAEKWDLLLAWLRIGNWVWYYCNDRQIVVRAEGGRAQIWRLFGPSDKPTLTNDFAFDLSDRDECNVDDTRFKAYGEATFQNPDDEEEEG